MHLFLSFVITEVLIISTVKTKETSLHQSHSEMYLHLEAMLNMTTTEKKTLVLCGKTSQWNKLERILMSPYKLLKCVNLVFPIVKRQRDGKYFKNLKYGYIRIDTF